MDRTDPATAAAGAEPTLDLRLAPGSPGSRTLSGTFPAPTLVPLSAAWLAQLDSLPVDADVVLDLRALDELGPGDLRTIARLRQLTIDRGTKLILRSSSEHGGRILEVLAGMEAQLD